MAPSSTAAMYSGISIALIHVISTPFPFNFAMAFRSASGLPHKAMPRRNMRFHCGVSRSSASSPRNSGRRLRLTPYTSALPSSAFNAAAAETTYSALPQPVKIRVPFFCISQHSF